MHLRYADLSLPQSLPNGKVLVYPTINQDCRTLNHFNRRALNSGCSTSNFIHPSVESFWVIISGTGTMKLGSETFTVQPRSLIIIPPDVPHSLVADQSPIDWFDLSFHSAVWKTAAKALLDGIGEPHGDHIQGQPMLIEGEKLPPQEGNTCYRYPHARPHSTLDHWDQNSNEPGTRAADHVHEEHEEFWYIHQGSGYVEQDDRIFTVTAGDLIGHPPGVHHTLVADKEPIRWYCFCMNRWLMPLVSDVLV